MYDCDALPYYFCCMPGLYFCLLAIPNRDLSGLVSIFYFLRLYLLLSSCFLFCTRQPGQQEMRIPIPIFLYFSDFPVFFILFQPPQLQMHLSPSSRGVGWANGYCDILITTRTQHLATPWASGGHGNIFSRIPDFFRTFFTLFSRICGI